MNLLSVPSLFRSISIVTLLLSCINSSAINRYDNGSSADYELYPGDSLFINSGTYTGPVNLLNPNAVIVIKAGANFHPQIVSSANGTIINYGYSFFNFEFKPNVGFQLRNYGTLHLAQNCALTSATDWLNTFGAILEFDQTFSVQASTITNSGEIKIGKLELYSGSTITNRNKITVTSNTELNVGTAINNLGLIENKGNLTNNGTYQNGCQLNVAGNLSNFATINNSSLITLKEGYTFGNSGFINLSGNGTIKASNLTNGHTITGSGNLYLTDNTVNWAFIGVTGTTTDTIKIYDVTRTNAPKFFDVDWGSMRPNVVFSAFSEPDPAQFTSGCAAEFTGAVPLPIHWKSFTINEINRRPNLSWKASYPSNTTFIVERSTNGQSFSPLYSITTSSNGVFNWSDQATIGPVSFYRIKAVESNGNTSYSETIKYIKKETAYNQAKVYPIPFSSSFHWSYVSTENTNVTIVIRSVNGQMLFQKTAKLNKGQNEILFAEAAELPAGIYSLESYKGNELLTTHKLVKKG
ncbi:T9SS type A sorting domain-containing protein [Flavisolibacter tropicus]|uniref:Secretion system C-terminal sorting domain-containing protein n=1 Tax=Flavisolibacter tropicus TaxID=1492898 RepID=A0A172TTM6_9BACT|nr:T9SS type A sorting domain-containing protein [Flavisolibacter tropicus]ANE50352.1 hypothetical protein SY85_07425 [Flavisolibacter tropicus]